MKKHMISASKRVAHKEWIYCLQILIEVRILNLARDGEIENMENLL
jgi:hypothetical protein